MNEPYLGEIQLFAGDFEPQNWKFCQGQLLPVSEHTALFSLIDNKYGGDGKITFGLPDFRGRIPIGMGQGIGLTERTLAEKGGEETVQLTLETIAPHNHDLMTSDLEGDLEEPENAVLANSIGYYTQGRESTIKISTQNKNYATTITTEVKMNEQAVAEKGGTLGHANLQPFLGLNYIICINGRFPSRS